VGDELHIVEAKGGAGRLGSREVAPDQRAQQGSAAYLANILQAMAASGNEEKAKIAKDLIEKLKSSPDKVRMWAISTSKLNARTSEELTVKIMKMDIP
jgi:ribosomal protein L18E